MTNRFFKSLLLLFLQFVCVQALCQETAGTDSINVAERRYVIGRFNECIDGLKVSLERKLFTHEQKVRGYSLLAMCYLAIDSIKNADSSIEQLLSIKEDFETDPRDPERFKKECCLLNPYPMKTLCLLCQKNRRCAVGSRYSFNCYRSTN